MMLSKEQAKTLLADVPFYKSFKLHLGSEITSLRELAEVLDVMTDVSFKHHVSEKKNDFALWIRDAIGDALLATQVSQQKEQRKIMALIKKRILFLENMQNPNFDAQQQSAHFLTGVIIGIITGIIIATLFL